MNHPENSADLQLVDSNSPQFLDRRSEFQDDLVPEEMPAVRHDFSAVPPNAVDRSRPGSEDPAVEDRVPRSVGQSLMIRIQGDQVSGGADA